MRTNVEEQVVIRLRKLMEERGWYTIKTVGNAFQSGLPDLVCFHHTYGMRLVEVKTPRGAFTPAQRREFHQISAHGGHIWVLVGDLPLDNLKLAVEIEKLRGPANWHLFL